MFHVTDIINKGLGVVALRDISPGERILSERPLATWRSVPGQPDAESAAQIAAIVAGLRGNERRAFHALADVYSDGEKTPTGIWMSNAFRLDGGDCFTPSEECTVEAGVFQTISRINHDCRPNSFAAWNPALGMQTVHALHEIGRGAEIVIAYLGGAGAWDGTRGSRHTELLAKCRLRCCCALCHESGEGFELSEARRRRVMELNRRLQSVAPAANLPSAFKKGLRKDNGLLAQTHELWEASAAEGLPAIWQRSAIIEAMMHANRTGDAHEALVWAERGARSARLALGAAAPTAVKFQAVVKAWSHAIAATPSAPLPGESTSTRAVPTMAAKRGATACNLVADTSLMDPSQLLRRGHVGSRALWMFRAEAAPSSAAFAVVAPDPSPSVTFSMEFEAAAAAMNPLLRRALVDDEVLDGDANDALIDLLCQLGNVAESCGGLRSSRRLLRRRGAIGASGCAALRQLVDADRNVERDSVDGKSQHQLNIGAEQLITLIGRSEVESLWRLADELLASQSDQARAKAHAAGTAVSSAMLEATEAATGGYHVDLFVRRYTRDTRPWIAFHQDVSNVTINVALSDDASHQGGRLHAILEGRHQVVTRAEGEATAHGDDVMHAVSAMRSGVRYSLIAFFYALTNDPEEAEARH